MENLASERIFEEWKKLILKGKNITGGLNFLKDTGWVKYFPELSALIDCKQDPEWHPEGTYGFTLFTAWMHTARERIG